MHAGFARSLRDSLQALELCHASRRASLPFLSESSVDSERWLSDEDEWCMQRRSREQLMGRAELDRVEKEFILNWNAAAQTKPVHGDLFVPGRVEAFAREHAKTLARTPDLRRCFINFCMILWDYCILNSATVDLLSTIVAAQP